MMWLRGVARLAFSPRRGRNKSAQGNALGKPSFKVRRPERAQQPTRTFVSPLQGFAVASHHPGRCPGLTCCCTFGAKKKTNTPTNPALHILHDRDLPRLPRLGVEDAHRD